MNDEEAAKLLFDPNPGSEERLSAEDKKMLAELREMDQALQKALDVDSIPPATDEMPDYLVARFERELAAMGDPEEQGSRGASVPLSLFGQIMSFFRMHPGLVTAMILVLGVVVLPVAFWPGAKPDDEEATIKDAPPLLTEGTNLLTPGAVTQFVDPVILWFSKHRNLDVKITSRTDKTKAWKAENMIGEVKWSSFTPATPLAAGGKYRISLVVDGEVLAARDFAVASDAAPLRPSGVEDALARATALKSAGKLQDAVMVLASLAGEDRLNPGVRALRKEIMQALNEAQKKGTPANP